jgi:hypothetical protein
MAIRTWVRLLLATLGVGALAGASQLGLAYGLGIVRLTRVVDVTTRDQWTAQLAWVAWFAMTAAVVGALVGARLLSAWGTPADAARPAADPVPGTGTVIALALAAGLGAAIVVPLTMQPARTAQIAGVHPVFVIGICAGLGAVVGVFAAVAALMQPVSRWGLAAVSLATWAIAIVSVTPSLAPDDPLPAVRLGVLDAAYLSSQTAQRMALFTMPVLALVIGALVGWAARRRERSTLTIALAGLPGPALLTLAYLIAGPGAGSARYQVVPYWAAMTATGAGVLGSVLAAVLRRLPADDSNTDTDAGGTRPPLPRRPEQQESAIAKAAGPPMADEELAAAAHGGSAVSARTSGSSAAASPTDSAAPKPGDTGISQAPPDATPKTTGEGVPGAHDTAVTEQPGRRSATSAPWGPPSGGPAPLGVAPGDPFAGPSLGAPGPIGGGLGGPPVAGPPVTGPTETRPTATGTAVMGTAVTGTAVTGTSSGGPAASVPLAAPAQPRPAGANSDFFDGGRPATPAGNGRRFRPSSWRRSSRKTGIPDPFATPIAEWPPAHGTDQPSTPASAADADDRRAAGGVAVGDYALGELPPFDGFARGAANSGKSDHRSAPAGRTAQQSATTEPAPYVPAPATSPLPPEILNAAHGAGTAPSPGATPPASLRPAGRAGQSENRPGRHDEDRHGQRDQDRPGRHDRGPDAEAAKPKIKRWGRGRSKAADTELPAPVQSDQPTAGRPLVPEPRAVSAPLPNPEPITPPITAPTPVQGSVADRRRAPRQKPGDDDYVDWVSGLGGQ